MPKHDKPILDIDAVRANFRHFRHWETRFHDYCLLECYRNPAKDRLTHTADHCIEAKKPVELAVLRSAIPSSEWNTLDDGITSKISPPRMMPTAHGSGCKKLKSITSVQVHSCKIDTTFGYKWHRQTKHPFQLWNAHSVQMLTNS